jgi:DNA-directed DNA polymerase III PolC
MQNRSIVHLDADAFFAAVEQAADPRLRGKPVAVGGQQRRIIASASYEARRLGIYTPMPASRARKLCPKLILLAGDFEKYERFSRWMFSYAYDFTPEVEITSIDEGYFDLTGARQPPLEVAQTIRQAIRQALKLSVSEGIGSNKLVSQIASKLNKPAAFLHVPPGQEIPFLHPLPNRWLPGIGPKTGARLDAAGLARIQQIAATPVDFLGLLVGAAAPQLKQFANGIDDRPVAPACEPAKSYSQQETLAEDQTDEAFLEATLRRMADHLMAKARAESKSIRTLTVKLRYNDMAEDQCSESLAEPTDLETDVYPRLGLLLRRAWKRRVSLRLVSLKFSNVYAGPFRDELLLTGAEQQHEARRRLAAVIDELRRARGQNVVMRGHDLLLREQAQGAKPPPPVKVVIRMAVRSGGGYSSYRSYGTYSPSAECQKSPITNRQLPIAAPLHCHSALRTPHSAIPLAIHSYYSFFNSTLSIQAIIQLARQHELPALALTDQGNLHGAVEFALAARQAGLKPIIGVELQWGGQPLWLYVQNATGYRNLCRLLTADAAADAGREAGPPSASPEAQALENRSYTTYRTYPTPHSALRTPHLNAGLLALSTDARLADLFPGRFYLAVSSPEALRKLSAPAHLPRVALQPIHYAAAADRWKYDVLQSIRTLTLLRQAHPDKQLDGEFHFRPPAQWHALFKSHPELLARSHEIAQRCSFEFTLGQPQFPAFQPPDASTPRAFLRRLVLEGLRWRYPARHAQLQAQVEAELGIIQEVGYEEYFLVVWDILQECRRRGIEWITRGSAADSLVCYCLGISDVCPIRFDLYFRRFLNKERMALNKLPDIDVDFPHDRKDDVVDLVFAKYGPEHTAVVGGFSTYQARGAVGDVAKVLGVSEHQIRRFTEHFPWTGARGLVELLKRNPECRDLPLDQEPYRSALAMAEFLDGFPRYAKMHPCGLVLSREPMRHLTPCFISNKGYPTTHFDMDTVEAIGLVKIDILAQGGLAVMRDVKQMLAISDLRFPICDFDSGAPAQEALNQKSQIGNRKFDDPEVWEMIASGKARAVHHIESPAMISLCRQCNVRDIDGLIAIVSVIRPGAANQQNKLKFTRRYQGLEPVTYPDPSLEPCLKSTFGLVVYEEHILQICEAFAGLPPGRADVLRRALGKEKHALVAQIQEEFFAAARARGHTEAKIAEVWGLVRGFSGYAFCKAHSAAYGLEAYQSAWLKRYFPAEFMAAVLTNGKGFYRPLVYVLECHRLGIGFLPPWVNEPGPGFTLVPAGASRRAEEAGEKALAGGATVAHASRITHHAFIRVPVTYINGLTDSTKERIIRERQRGEFASLADFYCRTQPTPEEMELLLRAGAFDGFGKSRPALFWDIQFLAQRWGHTAVAGQGWLLPPADAAQLPQASLTEPTRLQRLQWELELLGFPASGHPLELYPDIAWETYCPASRLGEFVGQQVTMCGLVIEDRVHQQESGEPMKFLTLADWTGMVETELFARTYQSYGLATVRYPVLEITATVEPFENGRGFTLRVWRAGKPRTRART